MLKLKNRFDKSDSSYIPYLIIKDKVVTCNDYLRIKGNVKNNGIRIVTQCLFKIIIYNQNNDIVSTDKFSIYGDIAPGKANSFHSIFALPKSAKSYKLTIDEIKVMK